MQRRFEVEILKKCCRAHIYFMKSGGEIDCHNHIKQRRCVGMGEASAGPCSEDFNCCVPIYIVNLCACVGWPTLGPMQTQGLLM